MWKVVLMKFIRMYYYVLAMLISSNVTNDNYVIRLLCVCLKGVEM